jgi:hypothetical protein
MKQKEIMNFITKPELMVMFCYTENKQYYMIPAAARDKDMLLGACIYFDSAQTLQDHIVELARETLPETFLVIDLTPSKSVKDEEVYFPCVKYEQAIGEDDGVYEGEAGMISAGAVHELHDGHPVLEAMLSGDTIPPSESRSVDEATEHARWRMAADKEEDSFFINNKDETVN